MDSKIFGNLSTYFEMYVCLSKCPLSRESLVRKMKEAGKKSSSVSDHVNKAISGDIAFISGTEEKLVLDQDALAQFLSEACNELNLEAQIQSKKKQKPEDQIASVTRAHSPAYKDMQVQLNTANNELKKMEQQVAEMTDVIMQLEKDKRKKVSAAITREMGKKVLVPATVKSIPPSILATDFFLESPGQELDESVLVSKTGGVLDSIYQFAKDEPPEITEETYWNRIVARFKSGKLFEKRLADQEQLEKEIDVEKESLDANRIKSLNMLLADEHMDNQTKLSTYAFWYFHDDPEMEDLLVFAGEHGINANYVIRLLEKPEEFRNYRTMRGFLKQVQMASEAHIKREAAQELLCGEWKVVAEYCGKECEFKMVPVEELENFRKCLKEGMEQSALKSIQRMLESTFGPMDQKLEEEVKDIEAPAYIHPEVEGVDVHVKVDDDAAYEGFSEKEVKDEQ